MRAGVRGMHEFIKTLADPHLEKCEQIGVGQVLLVRRQLVEVCQTRHGGGCSLQSNLPPFQQKDFLFCEAVSDGLDAPAFRNPARSSRSQTVRLSLQVSFIRATPAVRTAPSARRLEAPRGVRRLSIGKGEG